MRSGLAGLISLIGLAGSRRIVVTNDGGMQGIGGGDAGRPAGGDRRNNLHRQGKQHDWKKFPQPPAHQTIHPFDAAS
jgi:hypothetical protein